MADTPTAEDINVFDTLDERSALEHFLGKNTAEAEALFRENFIHYSEDLMWMGHRAFCFYIAPAVNYVLSPEADGDSDAANCFHGCVQFRVEHDPEGIRPALPLLRDAVATLASDLGRFEIDPAIYGDLAAKYRVLLASLDPLLCARPPSG